MNNTIKYVETDFDNGLKYIKAALNNIISYVSRTGESYTLNVELGLFTIIRLIEHLIPEAIINVQYSNTGIKIKTIYVVIIGENEVAVEIENSKCVFKKH